MLCVWSNAYCGLSPHWWCSGRWLMWQLPGVIKTAKTNRSEMKDCRWRCGTAAVTGVCWFLSLQWRRPHSRLPPPAVVALLHPRQLLTYLSVILRGPRRRCACWTWPSPVLIRLMFFPRGRSVPPTDRWGRLLHRLDCQEYIKHDV